MKSIKITTYWTPEEAHCIYQLLDELKSAVWASYGTDIQAMFEDVRREQACQEQSKDVDDEIDV